MNKKFKNYTSIISYLFIYGEIISVDLVFLNILGVLNLIISFSVKSLLYG